MIYTTEIHDGKTGLLIERDVYDTTASTCTTYGSSGQQLSQRPLTAAEIAAFAAEDVASTSSANQATIQQQAASALATNRTFIGLTSPTNAQVVAQVQALSRQMNGVIRLLLNQFDGTN